tara:strand:- start:1385 stop:1834 length:450 start_codon:yes stop_codon:yes gene_type:complete
MTEIELNKTYSFEIKNLAFGDLTKEDLIEIYKDGRVASHLLERHLTKWFPQLTHVPGCADHDHLDSTGQQYDAKNFTKSGLNFKPSKMLGVGRTFDYDVMVEKASKLIYIACDIVDFPKVRVVFKSGSELARDYPNGNISKTKREVLFS